MNMIRRLILASSMMLVLATFVSWAQRSKAVQEIARFVAPLNRAESPKGFSYAPDGNGYLMLSDDRTTVDRYDIRSGNKVETLFNCTNTREISLPEIEGFEISPDGSKILVWTDSEPIYRRSSKAKYYVYEIRTRILMPLSSQFDKQQEPVFSPDGRMVAFVVDNNIYIKKLDYKTEVAVTTDGMRDKVINGIPDWSYEEEFDMHGAMTWAPDNLSLCYIKFNETDVPLYSLPIYQGTCEPRTRHALYPGTYTYKYPVAGEKNSMVSVHHYDIETRKTKDITLPDQRIEYIPRIQYAYSPDRLMVVTMNRDQNRMEIYSVNPKSTVVRSVYVEESSAWISPEAYENIAWAPDYFIVTSTRTGFAHLYQYSYAGALLRTITKGDFDVTASYGFDAAGSFFYQAAAPTPLDRTIYRIDRKGVVSAVSETSGTSSASFSPDMKYAMVSYSNASTPPVYVFRSFSDKFSRTIEDNAEYAARYANLPAKEFFTMESEGNTLNGWIIRPKDTTGKCPVVMYQYSGPGSQSVLNRWEMDWMYYFVQQGFIVACVDGRGTGGRGRAFSDVVYRDLGHYETIDQINAAKYIASLPGVDPDRIGIFGWSYGGYETLMAASVPSAPYSAAVAVAPVTDWRFYDTIYTERYMLTPQQNNDGYNRSAPLKRVGALSCPLLLMYGTLDDNVHPANTLEYVSALQSKGMTCDMFVFPNMNHSINGCNARAVVYGRMFDFFANTLRP